MTLTFTNIEERLRYAKVLIELGELNQAEFEVAEALDESPEHLEALSLFAKLKHIRGQLSLAVACAAQIQSKSSGGERARMHLESMLHLAQDPTRGAGEFLALGQFQLVQKPTAYLALEEAFRQYVNRRPNEACATCRQVANRYRTRERDVYKLAVLAEAWLYELIGDLEVAGEILETLGRERGLETDLDRLLALVSLYEKSATRERLESAVNICRYLEQHSAETSIIGRLAILHRRLGNQEEASQYEERHLTLYRRMMHRADFDDVVSVAARHFLPLEMLRKLRLPDAKLPPAATPRETAIALAIQGDFQGARNLFSKESDLLDWKYLANVEDLIGEKGTREKAVELYSKALRADPYDRYVIGWLLERGQNGSTKPLQELFRDKTVVTPVMETLESAVHATPGDYRIWRRLAALLALQNADEGQQRQFAERATSLERTAQERNRAIGRVLSAAMYQFAGKTHGLIHEVWATREFSSPGQGGVLRRDDILGNVTEEMRGNIRNTFLAAREYAQAKFPHLTRDILDYNYGYKVTKDDERSGGISAGLPTALAFLSLFLQRPVPQDIASTGDVVTDAHDVLTVRLVGDIESKVDGAYHRNLRMILVPTGNRPVLERSSIVPRAITEEIVRFVSDLDAAVRLVFGELEFL